jgi:ERCC4-type nuclease
MDTREQNPLDFRPYKERFSHIIKATLEAGDYTVYGYERRIVFERKSLQDLTGSLTHGRERFLRELEKLAEADYAAIIVEASYNAVAGPYKHCKANPDSILASLQMYQVRFDIDVIFACTRLMATEIIVNKLTRGYTDG